MRSASRSGPASLPGARKPRTATRTLPSRQPLDRAGPHDASRDSIPHMRGSVAKHGIRRRTHGAFSCREVAGGERRRARPGRAVCGRGRSDFRQLRNLLRTDPESGQRAGHWMRRMAAGSALAARRAGIRGDRTSTDPRTATANIGVMKATKPPRTAGCRLA